MKIDKPDELDIRVAHHFLYKGMSQKAVAAAANISSTVLSRRLSTEELIVKNPVYEIIVELIASVESGQPSIGRGIWGMINQCAVDLGLVETAPGDILPLAIEKLKRIEKVDIEILSPDEQRDLQADAGELSSEASRIHSDVIAVRRLREVHAGRNVELSGGARSVR